jgi:uncharacterized protein YjbI with pentapeptide repeats
MANPEHVAKLKEGIEAWNAWRDENPNLKIDLSSVDLSFVNLHRSNRGRLDLCDANLRQADLHGADLMGAMFWSADLRKANLQRAKLAEASFRGAYLAGANLREASLEVAWLEGADLRDTDLSNADLERAHLYQANLSGAYLAEADLSWANLIEANLAKANLAKADLYGAILHQANLREATLRGADLTGAGLIGTHFEAADLTDCKVFGISVWGTRLEGAIQSDLVITPENESPILVDNLEVAQFVFLLLNNERIRHVIDTITSKVVLILGRFTTERKQVLDAIRDELRKRDYLPILFDFQKPDSKSLTGTVQTLANMARFIIADLTDPSCIPYELATVVPYTKVPVQTIILDGKHEFAMFNDLLDYRWVLPPYRYQSEETLLASLNERVIAPAEAKVIELKQK